MNRTRTWSFMVLFSAMWLGLGPVPSFPADENPDGTAGMSKDDLMDLALSAAPDSVASHATIKIPNEDGDLVIVRHGSNGFTCIPTVSHLKKPDPLCMDEAVAQWADDFRNHKPEPSNTVPGIGYMAKGGVHWEKDGKIYLTPEPDSKEVREPSHWMIMWPFSAASTGLPTLPNRSGVYIMFDGTPYAHLMIEQDPRKMK